MSISVLEATEVETHAPISLEELARRTGLIVRPFTTETINRLFDELESGDADEQRETFEYLKRALNETRALAGAEPIFPNE